MIKAEAVKDEKRILKLIQGLPDSSVYRILKFLETIELDSKRDNGKKSKKLFAEAMGTWKYVDTVKIYRSLNKQWKNWVPSV